MSDNQNNFNNQKSEDYFENSIEENISLDEKENENNITKSNVNEKEKEEKRSIKNNQNALNINSELYFKKKENLNIGKNSDVDNKNENEIKKELINELIEKEKLLQQLITSNSELKAKIEYSNKKFEEIKTKIKNQEKEK